MGSNGSREGDIFVAVVDPGVGTPRARLIVRTKEGKLLIGPDNGLLSLAFQQEGVDCAVCIENNALTLLEHANSCTFEGRDVFAPAAAHLFSGVGILEFGPQIPNERLARISLQPNDGTPPSCGFLADIDSYGNLRTTIPNDNVSNPIGFTSHLLIENSHVLYDGRAEIRLTFEGAGKGIPIILPSSTGCLDIAVNLGHASEFLGIGFEAVALDFGVRPVTRVEVGPIR